LSSVEFGEVLRRDWLGVGGGVPGSSRWGFGGGLASVRRLGVGGYLAGT